MTGEHLGGCTDAGVLFAAFMDMWCYRGWFLRSSWASLPRHSFLLAAERLLAGPSEFLVVPGPSAVAAVLANGLWFQLGRKRASGFFNFSANLLEPDSCVRGRRGCLRNRRTFPFVQNSFWPEHG